MAARIISTLAFLSLLGLNQAADPNCEDLTKPLVLEDDYSSIMGKWIFTEGIANHDSYTDYLNTINSSWIELAPSSLKDTVIRRHGRNINGKCEFQTTNSTITNSTISTTGNYSTFVGDFLPSCPDCLTFSLTVQKRNETFKALYLFTRSPKVAESEKDLYWKQAACLGYKTEPQFSYDGIAELCKDDQIRSSTDQTKPEEKKED